VIVTGILPQTPDNSVAPFLSSGLFHVSKGCKLPLQLLLRQLGLELSE
jgi:hypothetical protein